MDSFTVGVTLENTEKVEAPHRTPSQALLPSRADSVLTIPSQSVVHPSLVKPSSLLSTPKNDRSTSKADTPIRNAGKSAFLPTRYPPVIVDVQEALTGTRTVYSFFYRMGKAPPTTEFPSLRMENVIPHAFATTWQASMEEWGTQIKSAVEGVSEMLAEGLGLDRSTFLRAGEFGSHLLAPTATDLRKYGTEGSSEFTDASRVMYELTV